MRQAHRALRLQPLHAMPTPCPVHTLCPTPPLWAMQLLCALGPGRCPRGQDTGLRAPDLVLVRATKQASKHKMSSQPSPGMTAPETVFSYHTLLQTILCLPFPSEGPDSPLACPEDSEVQVALPCNLTINVFLSKADALLIAVHLLPSTHRLRTL